METIVGAVVGALVWVVANAVYLDKRRRSERGFARILAFWFGLPATFVSMVAVEEGSQPVLEPPPDDEEALLAEVRRQAALIEPPTRGGRDVESEEGS